jgi:hypothetical protein
MQNYCNTMAGNIFIDISRNDNIYIDPVMDYLIMIVNF